MGLPILRRLVALETINWTKYSFFKRVILEWFLDYGVDMFNEESGQHVSAVPQNWVLCTVFKLLLKTHRLELKFILDFETDVNNQNISEEVTIMLKVS